MATKPAHRVEFVDGPDHKNCSTFFLFWMADYHPGHPDGEHGWRERGQIFHCVPSPAELELPGWPKPIITFYSHRQEHTQ